jgi:hypothetical protein
VVAAVLYLVLALPQLHRPLTYDEVDFAKAARAVAGGEFRYDRGYIADYPDAADSGQRLQLALFHPPGYLLALAAWERLMGDSDAALRGFGVWCGLASLAGTVALAHRVGGRTAAAWAAALWASAPYAVQSTLLLDIDGTVVAPTMAVFAALALPSSPGSSLHRPRYGWGRLAALTITFALALWCKLTTPWPVALGLLIWLLTTGRRGQAAGLLAAIVAGSAVFAATWSAFAFVSGLPVARPFSDLWYELTDALRPDAASDGTGAAYAFLYLLVSSLRTAQWLHPLAIALLVAAPLALRRSEPAAGLLLAAGVTVAVDLIKLAAGFPKYHAGVLPLAAAAVGTAAAVWTSGRGRSAWRVCALAGAVVGAVVTLGTGGDALIREADLPLLAAWLAVAATLLALARPLGAARPAALAVGLLLGANVATAVWHVSSAEATTYFYGTTGQVEAGRWLRTQLRPREVVAADREVAYYAAPVHFVDSERFHQIVTERQGDDDGSPLPSSIRLLVSKYDRFLAGLPEGSRLIARFGAYQAWEVATE